MLSLSEFGAPQQHGQRSYSQPIEYWDSDFASKVGIPDSSLDVTRDRGIQFNEHWGNKTIDGKKEVFSERRNYYHKPQITLKDFWKVNEKLSWSNIIYMSIGRGGGQRYFNSASTIIRDSLGLFDWDEINFAESAREMIETGDFFRVKTEIFRVKDEIFRVKNEIFNINHNI